MKTKEKKKFLIFKSKSILKKKIRICKVKQLKDKNNVHFYGNNNEK
jgi:hypothetical protein